MTDMTAFVAFLREEERRSYDEIISAERAVALSFYNGELYGDEEEGRSQVVTRDVSEVVDPMTVSVLRAMISGDRAVEFEHPDSKLAEQATMAVSRTFFQGQRGYHFLGDWIKAGLLEKSSVAKCCVEPQRPARQEATVSTDELTALTEQGVEIVQAEQTGDDQFDVAWLEKRPPLFRDYVIPNEQCSFAQDATDLDDDCVYFGLHHYRTLSQLTELGFETEGLSTGTSPDGNNGALWLARDGGNSQNRFTYNRSGPNRRVVHHEEYVRFDLNEDGVSELLLVHRVNDTILTRRDTGELAIDPIEEQPGVAWCPFPMPHRIIGQSLADKSMDIQRIASVLMRQALDNLYQTNSPRWVVPESSLGVDTINDLLTPRAGGIIRHVGAMPPQPVTIPFAADAAFKALEVVRGDRESRTGITRMNQGLDADALNKTATGTSLQMAAGQQIEEYIARNFAEAFARLMLKKYRLMRQFGEPFEVVIDGETVMVDPRQWPDDMQTVVRVGLGTGRKDQRVQYRMQLLEIAAASMQNGLRIFTEDNVFNNIKGLIADTAVGSPHTLVTDPAKQEPAQPKQDPEMAKLQAEQAMQQAKIDGEQQLAETRLAIAARDAEHKQQLARDQAEFDAELADRKAQHERDIAEARLMSEQQLAETRMGLETQLSLHKANLAQEAHNTKLSTNRPGGALDA